MPTAAKAATAMENPCRSANCASDADFGDRASHRGGQENVSLRAVAAFAAVGMPTPEDHYTDLKTRKASGLERARFQVVADLYAELNGAAARTTELEVFDLAGSAVAGQHLGSKVIVGAELIAGGFDAAAGTILHELAHEAGGEEDIRFLRRLTNLIGATIREPEKIRDARRRYGVVRSRARLRGNPLPAAALAAYSPERSDGDDVDGVVCTVLVPPGFPPSEKIVGTLRAAAADVDVKLWVQTVHVHGPVGAVTWRAPGVPTLYVGGADAGGPLPQVGEAPRLPADDTLGYRLRTYGPDGQALCPDRESLRAAIRRAKESGRVGQAALYLHSALCKDHRARLRDVLGIEPREPPPPRKRSSRDERDALLYAYLREFIGDNGGFDLEDTWPHGQEAACAVWVRAARKDRRSAAILFDEISDRLNLALTWAYELEDADPDHDDADAFEREAMLGAQGAAISAYALGADEAEAKARAEEAFKLVRAATTRVLDLDVAVKAKGVLLFHALKCAGLGYEHSLRTRSFDGARFQEGLEQAVAEGLRLQRGVDDAGGWFSEWDLKSRLEKLAEDPRARRRRRRDQRRAARFNRATHAIRDVYERALAESGSEIAAAQRSLEEAARLLPEGGR